MLEKKSLAKQQTETEAEVLCLKKDYRFISTLILFKQMPSVVCCVFARECVRTWLVGWKGQADMTGIISVMESNQIPERN